MSLRVFMRNVIVNLLIMCYLWMFEPLLQSAQALAVYLVRNLLLRYAMKVSL